MTRSTVTAPARPRVEFFRVSVLGPLSAESERETIHIAGTHRRCLLALLASRAGRVVGTDAIVDALWGEDPPATAAKTVQSHVLRLRRTLRGLGPQVIETAQGGYRLVVTDGAVDAVTFEELAHAGRRQLQAGDHVAAQASLTEALGLWRGPAYLEFRDTQFGAAEGARLDELHLGALEDLAASQIAGGAAVTAVAGLERLVHEAPGRETAWALLMKALYATGRQHDALNAFQRARRALGEFGLEPGTELRGTEQMILDKHPSLDPVSGPTMLAAALRTSAPLVGRVSERRELATAWQAATSGTGQLRVLTGPLESGRTRLVADLAGRVVADGGTVDYARGDEALTALERMVASGAGRSHAGGIVDAIAERCRARPLLLVIDDAEWVTSPAVDAIRAISNAVDQIALLLLIVLDTSGGGPAAAALARLDPTGASTIPLAPMPDHDIAAVVSADGVEASAVAAIVAMSNGLPGVARREGAIWAERTASERLRAAAVSSVSASAVADRAYASVLDEVVELVEARARRDELWSARWAGRQPYRALSSYGTQDAELFVGRERLVAELAARVLERRLVVVVGASGSGKSSLLRAGLVPLARSGRLPGGDAWTTHVMVPGFDPLAAVDSIDGLDEPGPRLLIVDQFEEVFAAATPAVERFVRRLVDLSSDPALDVHIVLAARSDEYAKLTALAVLGDLASKAPVLVGPPSDDELRRIVVEPARRTGTTVEPALVDAVAADVGGYEAALPLVSATMAELWDQREAGVVTYAHYVQLGGLATVVERLGDRALGEAGEEHTDGVRRVLLMLADVTDDGVWTRRRVSIGDLPADTVALDALVGSRLVVRGDDTVEIVHEVVFRAWPQLVSWLEDARTDLVIERDLRAAARTWDADGRPEDHLYRGIRLHAALEWAARADGAVQPLVDEFLGASRDLAARDQQAVADQLRRERRARRRVSRALAVAAALLVAAIVAGVAALVSRSDAIDAERAAEERRAEAEQASAIAAEARDSAEQQTAIAEDERANAAEQAEIAEAQRRNAEQQADETRAGELAGLASLAVDEDPERAILLALAARERTTEPSAVVLSALHRAAQSARLVTSVPDVVNLSMDQSADGSLLVADHLDAYGFTVIDAATGSTVTDVKTQRPISDFGLAVHPTGSTVAVAYAESPDESVPPVELFDATSGELVDSLPGPPGEYCCTLQFDATGRWLGDLGPAGHAIVWDVALGGAPRSFGGAFDLELLGDGASVVVGRLDGTLTVYDLASGRPIREIPIPAVDYNDLEIDPTGTLAALVSNLARRVYVVDMATGELRATLEMRGPVFADFGPAGGMLAVSSEDGLIRLYDTVEFVEQRRLVGSSGLVWFLFFAPDESRLVSAGTGEIRIWDISPAGPDVLGNFEVPAGLIDRVVVAADESTAYATAYTEDGFHSSVHRVDLDGGAHDAVLPDVPWYFSTRPLVSPDLARVATMAEDDPYVSELRSLTHGRSTRLGRCDSVRAFDGTGRVVAVDSVLLCLEQGQDFGPGSRIVDLETNETLLDFGLLAIYAAAFGPARDDGSPSAVTVIDRPDFAVTVYDLDTGETVASFSEEGELPISLALSDDGERLALLMESGRLLVMDASRIMAGVDPADTILHDIPAHAAGSKAVAFSSSGLIATGSSADGIKIWSPDGTLVASVPTHQSDDPSFAFAPGTDTLYYDDGGGVVRRFPVDVDEVTRIARSVLTRGFMRQECERYFPGEDCPTFDL